jgi:hypothetical protein
MSAETEMMPLSLSQEYRDDIEPRLCRLKNEKFISLNK